jgi:hypothetical protein
MLTKKEKYGYLVSKRCGFDIENNLQILVKQNIATVDSSMHFGC